jgi:hypothetical protein
MLGCDDLRDGIAAGFGIGQDEGIQHGGRLRLRKLNLHTRLKDECLKSQNK